tara:strand:+ start:124 stop:435 length:312 start_codon:yes stop_codon:yes gene_type:complete
MRNRDIERELFIDLINHQLKDHGVTYDDVKDNPQWYMEYKTTREKEEKFSKHITETVVAALGLTIEQAEKEAQWFILQWGLTVAKPTKTAPKKASKKKTSSKK